MRKEGGSCPLKGGPVLRKMGVDWPRRRGTRYKIIWKGREGDDRPRPTGGSGQRDFVRILGRHRRGGNLFVEGRGLS